MIVNKPKNIVILFDGTGNEYNPPLSNIGKLANIANYSDSEQLIFYDPGVGTRNILKNGLELLMEKMFGWGVTKNIVTAYTYLMDVYKNGDNVYIFGFSRGAYTARALAGVLHKVGLLHKDNEELLPYIARLYLKGTDEDALYFKKGLCQECVPHFLGLFDTVASRGYFSNKIHPLDAALHPDIMNAYQALAIDEKRAKFQPLSLHKSLFPETQTVEQVWFAGCHSDIGGGFDDCGLANLTLKWMLSKAVSCGLLLKSDVDLTTLVKSNDPFDKIHESYKQWWKVFWRPCIRQIPEGSQIHRSVLIRMQHAKELNYNPPNFPKNYIVNKDI